jgi:D-alanyl-D-alanine carboxypeptidase
MQRRFPVCAAAVLSLLATVGYSAGRTSSKPALRSQSANVSRASADTRCAPCANKSRSARDLRKRVKNIPCHPKDYVDPHIAANYKNAMQEMKRASIKPQITSVYRSSQEQARLNKCTSSTRCRRQHPGLYYALPPGQSAHEAGLAVDIAGVAAGPRGAKRLTPKGRRIVAIMRKNGFKWRYGLSDPAHFEADPRQHGYRNLKQAIAHTHSTCRAGITSNSSGGKTGNPLGARNTPKTKGSTVASGKQRRRLVRVRA